MNRLPNSTLQGDAVFRRRVLSYWRRHGRHDLPWRRNITPYRVLVSEVMLQQTQVDRVIPFYQKFLAAFPTFRALARAPVADVLKAWQGLGYNRRALMLQRCAQTVVRDYSGRLPQDHEVLCGLPGIGLYTAGAVMAFAFNRPRPVIETNIRRVYIHHYFPGQDAVDDAQLLPIVERTLGRRDPRRWYSALMDYGTYLAGIVENPNRRSRQYVRQSKFEGSVRQLRGRILRMLVEHGPQTADQLRHEAADARLASVVDGLIREGFVVRRKGDILGLNGKS